MIRLFWGNSLNTAMGNAYGYSVHYRSLRAALDKLGVENTFASDVAVHITPAVNFKPIPGKRNLLYSMYECVTLPPSWVEPINKANAIIVPCRQNRDLFRQYTKKPIYVVHEGCDTELYKYHERKAPEHGKPFTFLWVGAPNLRKGFAHLGQAWTMWMVKHPDLIQSGRTRLYMKSSGIKAGDEYQFKPEWNIMVDPRSTTGIPMRDIYYDAHAFILPSMGEGWGLTLIEAAATGLPCIYTPWSGPCEFMDKRYSYPVKWKFGHVRTMKKVGGKNELDHETDAAHADYQSIFQRMEQIYYGYDEALKRGKQMSEIIHRDFTWEQSALKFLAAVTQYADTVGADIGQKKEAVA